jgi:prepilin-type processing-associated H-X9-DG protein
MRPINYTRHVPATSGAYAGNDQGWAVPTLLNPVWPHFDHMRWLDRGACAYDLKPCSTKTYNHGKGYTQDNNTNDENHMGGPHPGASPTLWADGSVRNYNYGYTDNSFIAKAVATTGDAIQKASARDNAIWQIMFAYNRSEVVTPP